MFKPLVASTLVAASSAAASPNVLMILADDIGVDVSPCYGNGAQAAKLPNLQQLCDQGMVFENAWAAPSCSPTRAMIMTGEYPSQNGVGSAVSPRNPAGLDGSEVTLFDRIADLSLIHI